MIIRFDHITYITGRQDKDDVVKLLGSPIFYEEKLKNIGIKNNLMLSPQDDHDLYFYDEGYPIEYIFYDRVFGHSEIRFDNDIIYGQYDDAGNAFAFLSGIFGNRVQMIDDKIECNMKGVLDKRDYILVLEPSDNSVASYLDNMGYGVVALVMNNYFRTVPDDGICTEYELLTVNNRKMEICFTRAASTNIIFEMIRITNDQ